MALQLTVEARALVVRHRLVPPARSVAWLLGSRMKGAMNSAPLPVASVMPE